MADNKRLNVDLTANDKASQKIEKVADKADQLDKMSPEVDVTADISAAQSALDKMRSQIAEFDGPVGDVGGIFEKLASPQGAVAGIAGGLLLAGNYASDLAIEADNLANLTGDSVESASRLNSVWKQSGADAKDLQDVLLQMGGVLTTNTELAGRLGVNLNDGKSLGERFVEVVRKVGAEFDDTAERSVAMSQLFGEEGVRQVNAVISQVGDLGAAIEAVPDGAVVDDDDVEKARQYRETLAEFKVEMAAMAATIGQEVLPLMTDLADLAIFVVDTLGKIGRGLNTNLFTSEQTEDPFAEQMAARTAALEEARDKQRAIWEEIIRGPVLAEQVAEQTRSQGQMDQRRYLDSLEADAKDAAERRAAREEQERRASLAAQQSAYEQQLAAAADAGDRGTAIVEQNAEANAAAMEAGARAAQEYYDRIRESFSSSADAVSQFSEDAQSSVRSFIDELATNTVATRMWQDNLLKIAEQTSPEFAAYLGELGPSYAGAVQDMLSQEGAVEEAFGIFKVAAETANRDMAAEMGKSGSATSKALRAAMGNEAKVANEEMRQRGLAAGQAYGSGLVSGIESKVADAASAAAIAGRQIDNAMRRALGVPEGAV